MSAAEIWEQLLLVADARPFAAARLEVIRESLQESLLRLQRLLAPKGKFAVTLALRYHGATHPLTIRAVDQCVLMASTPEGGTRPLLGSFLLGVFLATPADGSGLPDLGRQFALVQPCVTASSPADQFGRPAVSWLQRVRLLPVQDICACFWSEHQCTTYHCVASRSQDLASKPHAGPPGEGWHLAEKI